MEDVSIRILRGRALLDSAHTWQTGEVRNPAEMAKSSVSGQPGNLRRQMEKSLEDRSVGSLPFDYSQLSSSGCTPDVRSDEPPIDLITTPAFSYVLNHDENAVPEISREQAKQEEETRQEMQTTALPKISLVKHNQVKALALELMAQRFSFNGKKKFTRVSSQFCESVERFLYAAIASAVKRHPSTGKVIKEF